MTWFNIMWQSWRQYLIGLNSLAQPCLLCCCSKLVYSVPSTVWIPCFRDLTSTRLILLRLAQGLDDFEKQQMAVRGILTREYQQFLKVTEWFKAASVFVCLSVSTCLSLSLYNDKCNKYNADLPVYWDCYGGTSFITHFTSSCLS